MQAVAECSIHHLLQSVSAEQISDSELVAQVRAGDHRAFREVYERYAPRMSRLAWRYHGNAADAEDAVQEAFASAWKNIGTFRGGAQLSTWLYRITVNACISHKRRNRRYVRETERAAALPEPQTAAPVSDTDLAALLDAEIRALKEKHRMAFLLFAVEGLTHAEIAETLDVTENTSKSLYRRARHTLIKRLARKGITEEELIQ